MIRSKDTIKKCKNCGTDLGKVVCKKCGINMEVKTSSYWAGTRYFTNENLVKYWSPKDILEDIEYCQKQRNSKFLVAETKAETFGIRYFPGIEERFLSLGKIIGFTWGYQLPFNKFPFLRNNVNKNSGYVDELAVKSDFRRKGIGESLLLKLMKSFKEKQMKQVACRTLTNCNAYPLFRKLGFRDIGRIDPNDMYENRVYLIKNL